MSFQTGLSGLSASSRNLDVIGNNIANANTVGMKSSRAEFSDLVASSLGSAGSGGAGIGVAVANVSQQFSQGNINITGNSLDVAINGSGFFQVVLPDQSRAYTRDGQFKLNKDGEIITNTGAQVMGFPTDLLGKPTSLTPQPMTVPTGAPIAASATTAITAEFNLDARAPLAAGVAAVAAAPGPPPTAAVAAIPATPLTTYGTSMTTYDSQGVAIPATVYLRKTAVDTWEMFTDPTSAATATATSLGSLTFGTGGAITGPVNVTTGKVSVDLDITSPNTNIGVFTVPVDLSNVTQFGTAFAVSNLTQDGYTAGELTGVSIDPSGVIMTRYSNGETQARGQIALADFRNVQGLTPTGGGNWIETFASGQAVQGSPGQGKLGELRAGAVEESNVDLTAELVNMMTAQRAYQANAQTIKTQDQVLSTLVNLR